MSTMKQPDESTHWVCACVKRDKQKKLSHIKMNPMSLKRCRVCGCTRDTPMATAKKGAETP